MTFQQIVNRIAELYPHGETVSTIINHINAGQDELSPYFGKFVMDSSVVAVNSQEEYSFPSGVTDCSEIKLLEIGTSATPADSFDYIQYRFHEIEKGRPSGNVFYQLYDSSGNKSFGIYPIPTEDGLPIRITYTRPLTEATTSTLTSSPDFDNRYHDLLVYYACYMICSSGASPDGVQADAFYQKFEDGLGQLWKLKSNKIIEAPVKRRDNATWYR